MSDAELKCFENPRLIYWNKAYNMVHILTDYKWNLSFYNDQKDMIQIKLYESYHMIQTIVVKYVLNLLILPIEGHKHRRGWHM